MVASGIISAGRRQNVMKSVEKMENCAKQLDFGHMTVPNRVFCQIELGSVGKLWVCGGTAVSAVRHGLSDGRDARPIDFSDRA